MIWIEWGDKQKRGDVTEGMLRCVTYDAMKNSGQKQGKTRYLKDLIAPNRIRTRSGEYYPQP